MEVLQSVSIAFNALKKVREIVEKTKNAEASLAIAEMTNALADLKLQVADLKLENSQLRDEIQKLSKRADVAKMVERRSGAYYLSQSNAGRPDGPYCTRCVDVDSLLVLLKEECDTFAVFGTHKCPECKQFYTIR